MTTDRSEQEHEAEVQRIKEIFLKSAEEEAERIGKCLAQPDHKLLGQTEFNLRDAMLRVAARTLETHLAERAKKGATSGVAPFVHATVMRDL